MVQYVFLVAIGRSGSTLLRELINTFDGVNLQGENDHVLDLARLLAKTHFNNLRFGQELPTQHPWKGMERLNAEKLAKDYVKSLENHYLLVDQKGNTHFGFKEIRWHESVFETFAGMKLMFPNAKYVFNFRDPVEISQSAWHRHELGGPESIEAQQAILREMAKHLGKNATQVNYEDYTSRPKSLKKVANFLGVKFDQLKVEQVLQTKLSH